jgi:hypothetical protein
MARLGRCRYSTMSVSGLADLRYSIFCTGYTSWWGLGSRYDRVDQSPFHALPVARHPLLTIDVQSLGRGLEMMVLKLVI